MEKKKTQPKSERSSELTFKAFGEFLKQPSIRVELVVAVVLYFAAYVILVNLFPLPSTLTDSANYVFAAKNMMPGGYRPYGYSWFLGFLHRFSSSIGLVTIAQFFITALSTLFFAYSVRYLFQLKNNIGWYVFLGLSVVSAPTLYMAHALLSDSLFCALTVVWFTAGLWVLLTRNVWMYLLHLLMLYWALEVRYTGLFYPAFTVLISFLSFRQWWAKWAGAVGAMLITIIFYQATVRDMQRIFGIKIFSGFSGWQLVSNALHVVPYVEINPQQARDLQTKMFLEFIKQTDQSIYQRGVSASLMWDKKSPLKMYTYWKMETLQLDYLRSWILSGQDFNRFGSYLIRQYPGAFFQHYILPNAGNVLLPPADRGAIARIEDITANDFWFEYYHLGKGRKFSDDRSDVFTRLSPVFSWINFGYWLIFIASCGWLMYQWRKKVFSTQTRWALSYLALFVLGYAAFNIFAGPYEYRYMIPIRPMLLTLPFLLFALRSVSAKPDHSHARQ